MHPKIEPLPPPYHAGTLPKDAWRGLLRKDTLLHNDIARLVRERLIVTFHVPPTYDHAADASTTAMLGSSVDMPYVRRDGDWHMDDASHDSARATYLFLPYEPGYERGRSCATGYIPGKVAHAVLRDIFHTCQRVEELVDDAEALAVLQSAIHALGKTTRTHDADARNVNAAMETLYRARWGRIPGIHHISYRIHREFTRICARVRWFHPGLAAFFADDKGIHSALKSTRKVPPVSLIQGHARYRNFRRKKV